MYKTKILKKQYFHICGMKTAAEKSGISGDPNYICAELLYNPQKGYYSDIRPVYKYMLEDVEMVGTPFGCSVAPGMLSEILVPCNRQSKKAEKEAIEIYDRDLMSYISRLRYRVDEQEESA